MGKGPARLASRIMQDDRFRGVQFDAAKVEEEFPLEVGTTFHVLRVLSDKVREAVAQDRLPLVLAGGCISAIGTLAGIGHSTGVLWLDAHGDFNTPETTISGFLDGMALATLVGRCWKNLSATINGFRPVPERQTILLGARDFDSAEKSLLDHSAVTQISPRAVHETSVVEALRPALATLRSLTPGIYLHIDLDVLDPSQARVNQFAVADGLTVSELLDVVRLVREHFLLAAVAITAYDPSYDEGDRALEAALKLVRVLHEPH